MLRIGLGKSDVGKIRTNNEDTIYVNNIGFGRLFNLFVVADGMGGHNAGEVASERAVSAFCVFLQNDSQSDSILDFLTAALVDANKHVHEEAQKEPNYAGMGTTFSACTFDEKNLYFCHVGDSRIYAINNEKITQLTRDHSLVTEMVEEGKLTREEARVHPQNNVITRAVGSDLNVAVDNGEFPLEGTDYFLLCSDGLTDMINDAEIFEIMQTNCVLSEKIDKLIARAIEAGGDDNISVIVIGWGDK